MSAILLKKKPTKKPNKYPTSEVYNMSEYLEEKRTTCGLAFHQSEYSLWYSNFDPKAPVIFFAHVFSHFCGEIYQLFHNVNSLRHDR